MGISMNSRQKGSLDIDYQRLNYIIFFEENHMEQKITEEDKRNACSLRRSDKTLRKSTQHKTEGVNQFSNSRNLLICFFWKKSGATKTTVKINSPPKNDSIRETSHDKCEP